MKKGWILGLCLLLCVCGEAKNDDFDKSEEAQKREELCPHITDVGGDMALYPFWYMCGNGAPARYFEEGYPGGSGPTESNVAAQWLFDESSGSIVDEVSGVTLAANGSPQYGITKTGKFSHLNPWIRFDGSSYFYKDSATSELDLGTNDAVFEFWFATTSSATQRIFEASSSVPFVDSYNVYFNAVGTYGTLVFSFFKVPGPTRTASIPFVDEYRDGNPHKVRMILDRNVGITAWVDDDLQTTSSDNTTDYAATSITAPGIYVGSNRTGNARFTGDLGELRITIGNITNNSTPIWYP